MSAPVFRTPTTDEFAAHRFTADQLARFEADGVLTLPGFLKGEALERLRDAAERRHARALADGALDAHTRLDTSRVLEMHDDFVELVAHPHILPKVVQLMGANIFLYHSQFNALPPTTARSAPNYFSWHWHQDNEVLISDSQSTTSPRFTVKVAYLLSDLPSDDAGNTWYVPGSQYADRRPPVDPDAPHKLVGARPMRGSAGTVIFMDTRIWHCGTPNHSDTTRLKVWMGYGFRWLRRYGDLGDLEALRDRCDPVMAQLLDLEGTERFEPEYVSDRYSFAASTMLPLGRRAGMRDADPHTPTITLAPDADRSGAGLEGG